jgi:hypothetical protein
MLICLSLGADITVTPGVLLKLYSPRLSALLMGHNVDKGDATALNAKAEELRMWW